LLNTQISLDNYQPNLQETIVYTDCENMNNDNITLENLLKIDFMQIFHTHPSQRAISRPLNDFSASKSKPVGDDEAGGNILIVNS